MGRYMYPDWYYQWIRSDDERRAKTLHLDEQYILCKEKFKHHYTSAWFPHSNVHRSGRTPWEQRQFIEWVASNPRSSTNTQAGTEINLPRYCEDTPLPRLIIPEDRNLPPVYIGLSTAVLERQFPQYEQRDFREVFEDT
jgi:hypothetical protein